MFDDPASWGLLAAVVLFVGFVLYKLRLPLTGTDPARVAARRKLAEAKQRARQAKGDPVRKARAFRDAAEIALSELERPGLAASFARRAERADPASAATVSVLAMALRRANRYRALERHLCRRLSHDGDDPGWERAFTELLALYEGPMRRADLAAMLRRLRGTASDKPAD